MRRSVRTHCCTPSPAGDHVLYVPQTADKGKQEVWSARCTGGPTLTLTEWGFPSHRPSKSHPVQRSAPCPQGRKSTPVKHPHFVFADGVRIRAHVPVEGDGTC